MNFLEYKKENEIKVKNRRTILNKYFYVYRITNVVQRKHYYGSRVSSVEPRLDIGIKYFSSSYDKEFMLEQKEFPERFKYKVVRICISNIEKQLFESYVHEKFNVGASVDFYNQVRQTLVGFDCTGHICNKGRKLSKSTKDKLREALTGRYVSEETKQKQREVALSRTKEENMRRGVKHIGKKVSTKTRELMRKQNIGACNNQAKIIKILDANGEILDVCNGTFKQVCEIKGYPWATLRKAKYGKKLYLDKEGKPSKNIPIASRKFIGWSITYTNSYDSRRKHFESIKHLIS